MCIRDSKYIGGGNDTEKVKLNKLSGDQWTKTTRRAKAAAKDLSHKRRNMWFNSMIREEPYPGLNCK